MLRGAFCQFPFRRIYYCHSSKFIGKETGKMHLCALRAYYYIFFQACIIFGRRRRRAVWEPWSRRHCRRLWRSCRRHPYVFNRLNNSVCYYKISRIIIWNKNKWCKLKWKAAMVYWNRKSGSQNKAKFADFKALTANSKVR